MQVFTSFKVGMRRLELPTSTSRTWRASQLCYIPISIFCNRLRYSCIRLRLQKYYLFFNLQVFPPINLPFFSWILLLSQSSPRIQTSYGMQRLFLLMVWDMPGMWRAYETIASLFQTVGMIRNHRQPVPQRSCTLK